MASSTSRPAQPTPSPPSRAGTRSETHPEIEGVGPDAAVVTNEVGAKQSATPYRFDLLGRNAIFVIARVLAEGAAKYGDTNWLGIPTTDHLNHALGHIFAHLAGDRSDDHLGHAFTRLFMAVEMERQSRCT